MRGVVTNGKEDGHNEVKSTCRDLSRKKLQDEDVCLTSHNVTLIWTSVHRIYMH